MVEDLPAEYRGVRREGIQPFPPYKRKARHIVPGLVE
jgi:hypothetical protein